MPHNAGSVTLQTRRDWDNLLPFHEYFHGDTGRGVGACHQTGWTALVADLVLPPPTAARLGTVMTDYRGLDACSMGSPPRPADAAPRPLPVAQVQPADAARPPAASLKKHECNVLRGGET